MPRIFIICEGKSEKNYIQSLNNILINQYYVEDLQIIPKTFNGGKTFGPKKKNLIQEIRKIKNDILENDKLYIWIDKDVFIRENKDKIEELDKEIKKSLKITIEKKTCYSESYI